jgi:deoxyribodipyrimidine photo-lyase
MQLFWHRRDLRVVDNRGLHAATDAGDSGSITPVFVLDPVVLEHAAPPRVAFLLDALSSLQSAYRDRGSDLLVEHGDPSAVLPELAADVAADRVIYNEAYSGLACERDEAVRAALDERDVAHQSHRDAVLHHPDDIRTNAGDPYAVYSYYWKKWRDRKKAEPVPAPSADAFVDADALPDAYSTSIPTVDDLGFDAPEATIPEASHEAARERLEEFCDGPIYRYEDDREYPARAGTSRLSTPLKFGTIGPREVWAETVEAAAALEADSSAVDDDSESAVDVPNGEAAESVREYQSQLAWREFYTQVLYHNPEVVTDNYRSYENPIEWREDETALQAWKDGETGYPIVDAGMRQLRAEAYVHNRVRMIVASFLTKDLLIDWREGYDWFRRKLVDHDTANDNGGWQWAASTGTDAQPYFRIFNPMTQGERYDPDAAYITEYVPELRGVDPDDIHTWHELDQQRRTELAPEYPAPIVDHSDRREAALELFQRARGEDE